MKLKQFPYGEEGNLAYLLWSGVDAAVIDGGAADDIINFISVKGLSLKYILNTHEHYDHIPGNPKLAEASGALLLSPAEACCHEIILGTEKITAIKTPGHSEDSIVFLFEMDGEQCLLSGDTIFNGTVGNCYTENYELYFSSIEGLLSYPPETRIFAGHDIVDYATGVVEALEPDNPFLEDYRRLCSKRPLSTTLGDELRLNPFIRYNDSALDGLRNRLSEEKGMPIDTSYERWRILMTIH